MNNIPFGNMSTKEQYISDVSDLLHKYGAWISYVGIGLVGKFGWDIVARKKPSGWYILGTGCMGVFVGFISSRWFIAHNPKMGRYIVPVLTLASRDVLVFIKLIDWTKILSAVFKIEVKNNEK